MRETALCLNYHANDQILQVDETKETSILSIPWGFFNKTLVHGTKWLCLPQMYSRTYKKQ